MTTSTSQGRRVPFLLGVVVFLFFIACLLITDLPICRFPDYAAA